MCIRYASIEYDTPVQMFFFFLNQSSKDTDKYDKKKKTF